MGIKVEDDSGTGKIKELFKELSVPNWRLTQLGYINHTRHLLLEKLNQAFIKSPKQISNFSQELIVTYRLVIIFLGNSLMKRMLSIVKLEKYHKLITSTVNIITFLRRKKINKNRKDPNFVPPAWAIFKKHIYFHNSLVTLLHFNSNKLQVGANSKIRRPISAEHRVPMNI